MQDKSHKWLLAAQAQMKTCQVNHLQKVFFYYPDRKLLGAKYIDFKPRGREDRGGREWDFGIIRVKLLYIGRLNNKVLLYSTGDYSQHPVTNHNGKNMKKNTHTHTHICN